MLDSIQRYFEFNRFKTNFRTEILAGLTAFLAMSYILSVNPAIPGNTGMDKGLFLRLLHFQLPSPHPSWACLPNTRLYWLLR